ncbi:unnamed protein product [Prunus armeniaca]|uniref:Uncharacterized protein n=1 Tax=Prunus armeniaca TaxID=36596 RepID=A0A6J5VUH5_PRUAR|nr:unnamed protein product [Prunus armeniaca]
MYTRRSLGSRYVRATWKECGAYTGGFFYKSVYARGGGWGSLRQGTGAGFENWFGSVNSKLGLF